MHSPCIHDNSRHFIQTKSPLNPWIPDHRFMMNEDKGKFPIQKSVNPKDYEIKISPLSTSPIQSPNRFQILGNFPPLPFAITTPTKPQNTPDPWAPPPGIRAIFLAC